MEPVGDSLSNIRTQSTEIMWYEIGSTTIWKISFDHGTIKRWRVAYNFSQYISPTFEKFANM